MFIGSLLRPGTSLERDIKEIPAIFFYTGSTVEKQQQTKGLHRAFDHPVKKRLKNSSRMQDKVSPFFIPLPKGPILPVPKLGVVSNALSVFSMKTC